MKASSVDPGFPKTYFTFSASNCSIIACLASIPTPPHARHHKKDAEPKHRPPTAIESPDGRRGSQPQTSVQDRRLRDSVRVLQAPAFLGERDQNSRVARSM